MPRIPTYTADPNAASLRLPDPPRLPPPVDLGAPLAEIATTLGQQAELQQRDLLRQQAEAQKREQAAAEKLLRQQEDLDTATLTAQYDAGLKQITQDLAADPTAIADPAAAPQMFIQRATKLQNDLAGQVGSESVALAFRRHVAATLPGAIITTRGTALQQWGKSQLADLDRLQETLASTAASDVPGEYERATTTFHDLVSRAEARGLLLPGETARREQAFRSATLARNMDVVGRVDPETLYTRDRAGYYDAVDPLVRAQVLEATRKRVEADDKRGERLFTEAQKLVLDDAWAQANQGTLPQARIDAGLAGRDPIIPAHQWRTLAEANKKPLMGAGIGDDQVRAIMTDYYGGARTDARVKAAREQLNHLRTTLGQPNELLSHALRQIQEDEQSAASAARGERATRAAEVQAGVTQTLDKLKAVPSTALPLPGPLGQMQRAKERAEEAELKARIRSGENPAAVLQDILRRRGGQPGTPTPLTPEQERQKALMEGYGQR